MTGMQLYVRFMFTLAMGLTGVGLVMTTILETVLREWDPTLELRRRWRRFVHVRPHAAAVRAEDVARGFADRRAALRQLAEAEERLASPRAV